MDKFDEEHDSLDKRDEQEQDESLMETRSIVGADAYDMLNLNEEMGAEFAVGSPYANSDLGEERHLESADRVDTDTSGYGLGWVSLLFAVASWFVWPVLMGATAAVIGFIAYRQGARGLGGWAMAIGLIALALNLIIVPFYYAVT